MADLKYVFEVDDKDVLATIKNHQVLEKRIASLKSEYAKLDAATNKGKVSIQDYARATQQLDQKIDHLQATVRKGGSAVNQLATGMNISGKSTRRMELQFQQAGYQIQDFIVQVQSGTNLLIAFSQQGSQLAGFFAGPWGAAIGLGIAAMSSLAMAMLSTSDKAEETVDVFKKLTEATRQLNIESMKLSDPKFDENLLGTQDELKKLEAAYNNAKAAVENYALAQTYIGTDITPNITDGRGAQDEAEAALKKAEADLKAYEIAKNRLLIAKTQATIDEQNGKQKITDQEKTYEQIIAESAARSQMEANIAKYANSRTVDAQNQAAAAKKLADKLGQAYLDALNLGKVDVSSGIDKAAEAARLLAKDMGISLAAATGIVNVAAGIGKRKDPREVGFSYEDLSKDPRIQLANQAAWKPNKTKDTTGGGVVAGKVDTQEEYLAKLAREYDMKKKSLGLTDEQIKRNEFLFTLDEKIATMKTKRTELEIETERKRAIAAYDAFVAAERQDALMGVVNSNMNDAFIAMVDGSATVADAFRNMMFNILKSVYEQSVTQPIANGITGLLTGALSGGMNVGGSASLFGGASWSANGDVVGRSGIQAFANGGVVNSATMFKHGGGLGVMGEAGPEAIMPLKRGSNGQLGVQVNGGSGGMTVNNNITVTGSDAAAVRMEVAKMIPQITNATKAAIIDAKKRGGQMGAAFA